MYVDINPESYTLDPGLLESSIGHRTRGILPVSLYGQCANMEEVMKIAKRHELFVVEDTAQAIGSSFTFSNGETKKLLAT